MQYNTPHHSSYMHMCAVDPSMHYAIEIHTGSIAPTIIASIIIASIIIAPIASMIIASIL